MMNFSSNTLFHYTDTMEKLQTILQNGLYTSYSKEMIFANGVVKEFAVPIISFCDIPLSNVSEHVEKYGRYAIGVSKDFAELHCFSKVFYLERYSDVAEGIFGIHDYVVENFVEKIEEEGFWKLNDGVLRMLQIIKNNVGPLIRKTGTMADYEFFKEMEWRYTPMVAPEYVQVYADFDELNKIHPTKPHLPKIALPLFLSDINWIIVPTSAEVAALITAIKTCKNLHPNDGDFEILMTKILSMEQIKTDF